MKRRLQTVHRAAGSGGEGAAPPALRAKVADPGFTPSLRDAPALAQLLGDEDRTVASSAERALARVGAPVVARLATVAKEADAHVRAGIARLFGRMSEESETLPWLLASLQDREPRVRRAAAHALGRHKAGAGVETALLEAFEREGSGSDQATPEVRAIVEALGKVGEARALARLRDVRTADPELDRILHKSILMLSRQAMRSGGQPVAFTAEGTAPGRSAVVVRCREGLEQVLREEIGEKGGPVLRAQVREGESGLVRAILTGPMNALFALRTMTSFAFDLGREPVKAPADVERVLVRAFTSPLARGLLKALTRGPVRYRIAWGSGGHRRAAVWRCAQAIAAEVPEWVNDPTESAWEVLVHELDGWATIEFCPRGLADTRFDYRRRDVPGASHPTIAAALVRVAGVQAGDVVWDPFVGSGTELVERAIAGAYAALHGSDTDPRAVEAARENFAAKGLGDVRLVQADATTYEPPAPVTLVITNPPMGRRVARSAELAGMLDRFVDHAARVLRPRGRLVWMSPHPPRSAERAKLAGLVLRRALDVDMGGFVAQLQSFTKGP